MADGRLRQAWQHTSSIMAAIAATDALRDPKKKQKISPSDFNPMIPRGKPIKISIRALKDSFT